MLEKRAVKYTITVGTRLANQIDKISMLGGYGNHPCEVIEFAVWELVNKLIEQGRITDQHEVECGEQGYPRQQWCVLKKGHKGAHKFGHRTKR